MIDLRKVSALCVCGVCLLIVRPASADPIDLVAQDSSTPDNPPGTHSCELLITLSDPGDNLLSIGFSDISTDDPAGFYQHVLGTATAPTQAGVDLFPELAHDSFVDIGFKIVPTGDIDGTTPDGDWDSALFNTGGATVGGWFNSAPASGQGVPDVNGNVFIA